MPRAIKNEGNISENTSESPIEDFNFPEPIANVVRCGRELIKNHGDAGTAWKDNAFSNLIDRHLMPIKDSTIKHLSESLTTIQFLEQMQKEADGLLSWRAGLGSWLSFFDIEMVLKRTTSRWFDGDGWGSTWK
jgi:hypothetical protein